MRPVISRISGAAAAATRHSVSTVRCFSVLAAKVPPRLRDEFITEFRDVASLPPKDEEVEKTAKEVVKRLLAQTDEESKTLLATIDAFRDPKYVALSLSGAPSEITAAAHFSGVIAYLAGYGLFTSKNVKALQVLLAGENHKSIPPHVDGVQMKSRIDAFSLVGVDVEKGGIKTGILEAERIFESLSETSREILAEPIFLFNYNMRADIITSPIIFREGGRVFINFTAAPSFKEKVVYDLEKSKFSAAEIRAAINEIYEVVNDLYHDRKKTATEFDIRDGDFVMMKNHRLLHYRDEYDKEKHGERVVLSVYYCEKDGLLLPALFNVHPNPYLRGDRAAVKAASTGGERLA